MLNISIESEDVPTLLMELGVALYRLRGKTDAAKDERLLQYSAEALHHIAIERGGILELVQKKMLKAAELSQPIIVLNPPTQ